MWTAAATPGTQPAVEVGQTERPRSGDATEPVPHAVMMSTGAEHRTTVGIVNQDGVSRSAALVGVISVPRRDLSRRAVAATGAAGRFERLEPLEPQPARAPKEVAAGGSRRLGHRGAVGAA